MTDIRHLPHAYETAAPQQARGETRAQEGHPGFCENDEIRDLIRRGTRYLAAGVPLHLSGAAGIGKTALSLRIAEQRARPIALITGHEGLSPADFVGREVGHTESVVVDRYIQSVRRKETKTRVAWHDAILAQAMEQGQTLIYDEFTRAAPQANVALLPVLEEGVLVTNNGASGRSYIRADPEFRIILTSNPSDYVASNAAPDALMDRLLTFHLTGYSAATETEIVTTVTGLDSAIAERIVQAMRKLRTLDTRPLLPSMRASLMSARIAAQSAREGGLSKGVLRAIVKDVVTGRAPGLSRAETDGILDELNMPQKEDLS